MWATHKKNTFGCFFLLPKSIFYSKLYESRFLNIYNGVGKMISLIIDEEFKNLIPPLSDSEISQLEENVLQYGIQDPLKVWNDILIDGHNRYSIAQKHGLDFKVEEMNFDSRADVIDWIIKNQFGRRNISTYDRVVLALKLKPVIAAKAKENQGERTDLTCVRNQTKVDTKKEIAKIAGVSHDTVAKVEKIEQFASSSVKDALKNGEISIHSAYMTVKSEKNLQELSVEIIKGMLTAKYGYTKFFETIEKAKKIASEIKTIDPDEYKKFCANIKESRLPEIRNNIGEWSDAIDEKFLISRLYDLGLSENEVGKISADIKNDYEAKLAEYRRLTEVA